MNILLIAGGWSKEREVSLNGGKGLATALERLGHKVTHYDPERSLDGIFEAAMGQDFAFINLHGSPGEDGLPQSMLESIGVPYQGSRPAGSFLALNKAAAKAVFRRLGLPTAEWELLTRRPGSAWQPRFGYPVFIKSNIGGSSLGLAKIDNADELQPALDNLFAQGGEFLCEPAISGMEVTCGVLGELVEEDGKTVERPFALPPILIKPKAHDGKFFDYDSKYMPGGAEEICPAPLEPALTAMVQDYALRAHVGLGLQGYSRTDFIMQPDGSLMLLEVNTLPGMTATSLIPQEAAAIGLDFEGLIARLIELGMAPGN